MTAICYSGPISAVPTNKQLLGEKRTCAKFQTDIDKTEGLMHVHIYRETVREMNMDKSLLDVTNFLVNLIYPVGMKKGMKRAPLYDSSLSQPLTSWRCVTRAFSKYLTK